MRTNIVIDDALMSEALALSDGATKRAVVQEALENWVQLRRQGEMKKWRGRLHWDGDLDAMRRDA